MSNETGSGAKLRLLAPRTPWSNALMKSYSASLSGCVKWLMALFCFYFVVRALPAGGTVTNGYIAAVLRSECGNAPTPPPPVGTIGVGTNYVIMTVADADPANWPNAQQVATDVIFTLLMPLYCDLPITASRSEEHTSELLSRQYLVCRLLLEKKKTQQKHRPSAIGDSPNIPHTTHTPST